MGKKKAIQATARVQDEAADALDRAKNVRVIVSVGVKVIRYTITYSVPRGPNS